MSNLSTRIATRKMSHKDVPICLDLDLIDQRDDAMSALDAAHRTAKLSDERMVSGEHPAVSAARERVDEIDAQIRDASVILRVYGVDRHTYNQWIVDCPPRKGRQELFDSSTFFMHAAKKSAVYVDENGAEHEITPDEWVAIDKMTDGEYDRLAQAVLHVNRGIGSVDVGFFGNGSAPTTDS